MKRRIIFSTIFLLFALCSQAQTKQSVKVVFTGLMYATYCDTVNLDFRNSEVKALAVSETEYGLEYTEMQIVPAGTGMLLHSLKPGVYTIPVTSEKPDSVPPTAMIGTLESTPVAWTDSDGCHNYILQEKGFLKANGNKLKAHHAYLHVKMAANDRKTEGDKLFQAMLEKEKDSAYKLVHRLNNPWVYRLLGVVIFIVGYSLYIWTKKRYRKM